MHGFQKVVRITIVCSHQFIAPTALFPRKQILAVTPDLWMYLFLQIFTW